MVFLSGPRQAGKTTLAQSLTSGYSAARYYNYDDDLQRRELLQRGWSDHDQLLIFDEIHKYPRWKNWVKGIYDTQKSLHRFLVTGSARLDLYRKGGDSLLGRYHSWRLHPLSLSERPSKLSVAETFHRLMTVGGFPEPFLDGDEAAARRWRRDRFERIIKQDIRDLEPIQKLENLSLFVDLLRQRVGSEIVLKNLEEDVGVSAKTLKSWLGLLENMYLIFIVRPYSTKLPRALKKSPKVYFYDTGDVVGDEGARFENVVATALLKRLHFIEDRFGYRCQLHYYRDKEGREVDFVITKDRIVTDLIEVKWADPQVSPALIYLADRLQPSKAHQWVFKRAESFSRGRLHVNSVLDIISQPEASLSEPKGALF